MEETVLRYFIYYYSWKVFLKDMFTEFMEGVTVRFNYLSPWSVGWLNITPANGFFSSCTILFYSSSNSRNKSNVDCREFMLHPVRVGWAPLRLCLLLLTLCVIVQRSECEVSPIWWIFGAQKLLVALAETQDCAIVYDLILTKTTRLTSFVPPTAFCPTTAILSCHFPHYFSHCHQEGRFSVIKYTECREITHNEVQELLTTCMHKWHKRMF